MHSHSLDLGQHPRWSSPRNTAWRKWTAGNLALWGVFSLTNVALWHYQPHATCIWETDFADARASIVYEQRNFTGALRYNETAGRIVRTSDGDIEYFGPPSDDIAQAWDVLLHNEFPSLTKAEAAAFEPELKPFPLDGEFHFEPAMFHSLHCINALRQMLIPVLYNMTWSMDAHLDSLLKDSHWQATHTEHCLDLLRQEAMCHGDLSPSPLYSWPHFPLSLGISSTRTCRKFEPIQAWMDRRAENGKTLQPE